MKTIWPILSVLAAAVLASGCASTGKTNLVQHTGESLVLVGEEPAYLCYLPVPKEPFSLQNTFRPVRDTIHYVEGVDFVVDYPAGTVRRVPGSRIPDFRKNVLYGQSDFDHTRFPGFGNTPFFVFANYSSAGAGSWPNQVPQTQFLKATAARLSEGKPLKLVAYGDSITAGGDATKPEFIFWKRWADELQRRYPRASITAVNGATGGDSTVQGIHRLQAKVLDERPDLVLIGFGMNDHNRGGVPIPEFEKNLKSMVARIRNEAGAEVILFSAFPPNPKWKFGTHRMEEYAAATARVALETSCAYADVFGNWQTIAQRKKPEDLLGNNINHPNDFGHWIYFAVLEKLGL